MTDHDVLGILKVFFALLGDGRTKYGKRIRAYLDGVDDLEDMPAIKRKLDETIEALKGINDGVAS